VLSPQEGTTNRRPIGKAPPLSLPSPSFRHDTGPARMRMMIAHHHASCKLAPCPRHTLIVAAHELYHEILLVAAHAGIPTSFTACVLRYHDTTTASPADMKGYQGALLTCSHHLPSVSRKPFCRPRAYSRSEVRPTAAHHAIAF
jgi:hypothetical protein